MTDNIDLPNVPEAATVPGRRWRVSAVWIVPLVAAIVAAGIAVQRILMEGPTITIVFNRTEGVEAGKTFVKYKEVNIGQATKVELSKDFRKVVVTAKIDRSAKGLLVDDTRFWIEQPRATLSGITGIGTLLSGNYIGLEPGKSKEERRTFTGLDMPPSVTFDEPGRRFVLQAATLGSIGNGSPLYYRKLNVGQVIGYDLEKDGGSVRIEVFVRAPYDVHVTDRTRFWLAGGIDMTVGADGLSVRTQSVLSMLIGGIAFETPPPEGNGAPAAENAVFALFGSRMEALASPETITTPFVLYFSESLRGLAVGAPVTYMGLAIGEVTNVGFEFSREKNNVRPRVDIVIYPRRFLEHVKKSPVTDAGTRTGPERRNFIENAVEQGFRAQLRSANLVTGQRYVSLDLFPGAPRATIDWTKSPVEMPVVPSDIQDLETKIRDILAKIERMPLDDLGRDLKKLAGTMDRVLKRIDGETLTEIGTTLEDLRRLLVHIDDALAGKDAPAQFQLREALQEIIRAARGVSGLTEYLERNPEALIRGKAQEKP
ncbi:MAG TPA: MlaD family protein [Syntrophales bacterium]|nr:MlaD family protein [Syntrophales bacterium]